MKAVVIDDSKESAGVLAHLLQGTSWPNVGQMFSLVDIICGDSQGVSIMYLDEYQDLINSNTSINHLVAFIQ